MGKGVKADTLDYSGKKEICCVPVYTNYPVIMLPAQHKHILDIQYCLSAVTVAYVITSPFFKYDEQLAVQQILLLWICKLLTEPEYLSLFCELLD